MPASAAKSASLSTMRSSAGLKSVMTSRPMALALKAPVSAKLAGVNFPGRRVASGMNVTGEDSCRQPAHWLIGFVTADTPLPHVVCYPPDGPAGGTR